MTNPLQREGRLLRCPQCGKEGPAPAGVGMTCGGSFSDKDHPAAVPMVPVEQTGEKDEG